MAFQAPGRCVLVALALAFAGCGRHAPYDASAWHLDALGRSRCFAAQVSATGEASNPDSGHATLRPVPAHHASASEAMIVIDNVSGVRTQVVDGNGSVFGELAPGEHAVLKLAGGSPQLLFAYPTRVEGFSLFGITGCNTQPCVVALSAPVKNGCVYYARLLAAVDSLGEQESKTCGELAKIETLRAPRALGRAAGVWGPDGGPSKKTREAAWYGRKQLETMPNAVQNTTLESSLAWCGDTP